MAILLIFLGPYLSRTLNETNNLTYSPEYGVPAGTGGEGISEYLLPPPPLSTRPKLNHVLKKGINIIRYNTTNGYSPATKRAFT